jgi:hypothetical protein
VASKGDPKRVSAQTLLRLPLCARSEWRHRLCAGLMSLRPRWGAQVGARSRGSLTYARERQGRGPSPTPTPSNAVSSSAERGGQNDSFSSRAASSRAYRYDRALHRATQNAAPARRSTRSTVAPVCSGGRAAEQASWCEAKRHDAHAELHAVAATRARSRARLRASSDGRI